MSPDWGARVHESARAFPVIIVICDCLESDGPLSNCPEEDSVASLSVFNRLSASHFVSNIDLCICHAISYVLTLISVSAPFLVFLSAILFLLRHLRHLAIS